MIIGMLNQKGGVGKTTLSVNIAHELIRKNPHVKVLVVDSDPQQSALNWSEVREKSPPFDIIGFAKKSLHRDLPSVASNYDFIVIDGPPRVTELARSCIMASDIIIIPCTPSPYDIWASSETVNLINESRIYKEKLKSVFAINRRIINTAIGRDVAEALEDLKTPVLKSHVSQRVIFAESAASGMTVFDMEPEGKAAQEITNLVNEILIFLTT
ncbi:MAG TPA: ParA family partition ATPase [Gammaproteobacteria bacterium]|nr:ParA family partition ATPase [Gammaproteobacteria bacterium]HRA42598.1 ParA family partition ATPase [Gammaproteobacteria bacterium]